MSFMDNDFGSAMTIGSKADQNDLEKLKKQVESQSDAIDFLLKAIKNISVAVGDAPEALTMIKVMVDAGLIDKMIAQNTVQEDKPVRVQAYYLPNKEMNIHRFKVKVGE